MYEIPGWFYLSQLGALLVLAGILLQMVTEALKEREAKLKAEDENTQKEPEVMHEIFVFGSNLQGIHGAGAALYARQALGAELGVGHGFTGMCYAIPTKGMAGSKAGTFLKTLPMSEIKYHVDAFIETAKQNKDKVFKVTRIGCGLAGLKDEVVAKLFVAAPDNCTFDEAWKPWLGETKKYWGTYGV